MNNTKLIRLLSDAREALADLEHLRWAGWMIYMFQKGTFNDDGTWTMPKWAVKRWMRQADTTYADLSDQEKESDRKEVDLTIAVILEKAKEDG